MPGIQQQRELIQANNAYTYTQTHTKPFLFVLLVTVDPKLP